MEDNKEHYMDIKKKFTDHELVVLRRADEQFGLTGKTDEVCPRCGGKLIYTMVSTSYSIECENNCGIKMLVRGL